VRYVETAFRDTGRLFCFLDFIHVLPKYLKRDEDSIALVVNKPVHRVREIKVS
jgi:hypothetical protein